MNKTVTVNIGGIVFHIDENAYERFKQYLESIRMHFTGSEGRDEIMQDIEARIAEMFQERVGDSKQVITLTDVEEVTTLMGKPEQFGDDELKDRNTTADEPVVTNVKRRLFRNPDDKLLGGVCSGISSYFDIDPVWIRLIFVFAFLAWGSGLLLYIILWIIIPVAETTTEKLQMKGEPININNIEKNVQEELNQVKKRLNELSSGKRPGNVVSRIFDAIAQLFRFLLLFVGKLVAAFLIFISLIIIFFLFVSLMAVLGVPGAQYPEVFNQIFPFNYQFGLAFFGAALVVGIPFLMLGYLGARILFNVRKSSRNVNMTASGLWVAGLLICIFLGASIASDFTEKTSIRKEIDLMQPKTKSLYLTMDKNFMDEKEYDYWDDNEWNGDLRLSIKDNQLQSRDINLDIVESKTDSFELVQICYARGSSKKIAADHASRISYTFNQIDSVLSFMPHFVIDKDEKYRAQRMQLILKVPKGGKVFLDKSLHGFIYDIKNVQNILDSDMLDRSWEMKADGLHCITCDGTESVIGGRNFRGDHHTRLRIDDEGVFIHGPNDDFVSIDSNGVVISKDGKTKKIRNGDVTISIDENGE